MTSPPSPGSPEDTPGPFSSLPPGDGEAAPSGASPADGSLEPSDPFGAGTGAPGPGQRRRLDRSGGRGLPGPSAGPEALARFTIPGDAQPGSYPLEVGLYTSADQKRLTLLDASGETLGDHVIIGSVTVAP